MSANLPVRWPVALRVLFRFAVVYGVLYLVTSLLYFLPKGEWLGEHYVKLWDHVVPHVGDLIGLEAKRHETGSGDTAFDWAMLVTYLGVAVVGAAVWSVLDRRRLAYPRLAEGMHIAIRYTLAVTMLTYGLAKVFWTQFPAPSGERLMRSYGESSPMGILWSFMGASYGYNLFTGLAECLGLLLLWRRTTLLGALIVAGVMTNVVVLNLCYDVPVKQYSMHLLLMALVLALPDLRRLIDFFVLHRPVSPRPLRRPEPVAWRRHARLALKGLVLAWLAYRQYDEVHEAYTQWGPGMKLPPWHGLYQVERHAVGGVDRPALVGDAARWKRLTVGRYGDVAVVYMDDHRDMLKLDDDPAHASFSLTTGEEGKPPLVFHYSRPDADHVQLDRDDPAGHVTLVLRKLDPDAFLLRSRGFHWVQEYPYNR